MEKTVHDSGEDQTDPGNPESKIFKEIQHRKVCDHRRRCGTAGLILKPDLCDNPQTDPQTDPQTQIITTFAGDKNVREIPLKKVKPLDGF